MKKTLLRFASLLLAALALATGARAQQASVVPTREPAVVSGVTISLSTSAFKLSDAVPANAQPTGGLIVRGFQASASLTNRSGANIGFVFPTPLDAARHFVFRVFDGKNHLLWDSNDGIVTPQVITKATLPKNSAWRRNVFVPITDRDGVFPPGTYTLEAKVNGSPEFSATATFKIAGAINPAGPSGIRGIALIGPIRPVEILGQPNTAPLPGAVIRVNGPIPVAPPGGVINYLIPTHTVIADAQGRFEIALVPGKYTVIGEPPTTGSRITVGAAQEVTVGANRFKEITVNYDSGIR